MNIAKMVKGVRKGPKALQVQVVRDRSDPDIRKEIHRRLQFDARVEGLSLIRVHVRHGRVIVEGPAGSLYEKIRIGELGRVEGIDEVNAGDLTVDARPADPMMRSHCPAPTDREITGAIRLVLSHDPRVSRFDIQVSVQNGVATLTGTVPFLSIRREAEMDAIDTVGGRSVKNQFTVWPESSLGDPDIRTRLLEAWSRDSVHAKFDLDVSVGKGTAFLNGWTLFMNETTRKMSLPGFAGSPVL